VDKAGKICRGDSGQTATELDADLISADASAKAITSMTIYNGNWLTSSGVRDLPNEYPLTNARAIAGVVTFALFFTNSSVNLGLGGFRVRVKPKRGLSDPNIRAVSGVLDTVIAANQLRFDPRFQLPAFWVQGLALPRMVVQAIDGVSPLIPWLTGPNIARRPNEIGNDEMVEWRVSPLPATGFPLTFSEGNAQSKLQMGEAAFVPTFRTANDGIYLLSVGSTNPTSTVQPSAPTRVTFQTIQDVLIVTKGFDDKETCNANCRLPNTTFQVLPTFLNTTNLKAFDVSVILGDPEAKPVVGDSKSFIRVVLVKTNPNSTAALTIPDAYTQKGDSMKAFWAPVRRGVATFKLGFVGSTLPGEFVKLEFSCPERVPAMIAKTINDTRNQCSVSILGQSKATTMPIQIIDPTVPRAVFNSPAVQAARRVVRIPTTVTTLAKFNGTDFKLELAKRMTEKFPFITADNADEVIEIVACEVKRALFGNSDLGSSVCGATGKCSGSNTDCPVGVIKCECPKRASSLSALLGRYLLQTSGSEVQLEATYNLEKATGFAATSETAISSMYAQLSESTTTVLKEDASFASQFGVDQKNVGSRSASAPVITQTPSPTPNPPPPETKPPPPPPATTAPVPSTSAPSPKPSSAYSLHVPVTTVLAALFLLALFW